MTWKKTKSTLAVILAVVVLGWLLLPNLVVLAAKPSITLHGKVLYRSTGEPVPFIRVRSTFAVPSRIPLSLPENRVFRTATTDQQGFFTIQAPNEYSIITVSCNSSISSLMANEIANGQNLSIEKCSTPER